MQIDRATARVLSMRTRIPFQYGIAEMTVTPHVVVEVVVVHDGRQFTGLAGEHLPPKWFTKDTTTSYEADLVELVAVVEHAIAAAPGLSEASTVFDLWCQLHDRQSAWARRRGTPPLLAGLGTSLVERAMIDAACSLTRTTFHEALHTGALGLDLGRLHPELAGRTARHYLPPLPGSSIAIRHTVGLTDPLTRAAITNDPGDGLPVALVDVLDTYGFTHLKIKASGDVAHDLDRFTQIQRLLDDRGRSVTTTLDGNERFVDAESFGAWWQVLGAAAEVRGLLGEGLLAIEQPLHRAATFRADVAELLRNDANIPPVIIDEADGDVTSVREAMDLGYAGGTYKGCKGVFRGIANACLVEHRGRQGSPTLMTAEDLSTVAPFPLLQDLAVAATVGLTHLERNGHHYFGRPAPVHADVDKLLTDHHPDLFALDSGGVARLRITDGRVQLSSVLRAPFGATRIVPADLEPLDLAAALRAVDAVAPTGYR